MSTSNNRSSKYMKENLMVERQPFRRRYLLNREFFLRYLRRGRRFLRRLLLTPRFQPNKKAIRMDGSEKRRYSALLIFSTADAVPEKIALLETPRFGNRLFPPAAPNSRNFCSLHVFNQTKKPSVWMAFLFGGEEEIRTPAPVSRPTPLAGAPLHQLEYFSVFVGELAVTIITALILYHSFWNFASP